MIAYVRFSFLANFRKQKLYALFCPGMSKVNAMYKIYAEKMNRPVLSGDEPERQLNLGALALILQPFTSKIDFSSCAIHLYTVM